MVKYKTFFNFPTILLTILNSLQELTYVLERGGKCVRTHSPCVTNEASVCVTCARGAERVGEGERDVGVVITSTSPLEITLRNLQGLTCVALVLSSVSSVELFAQNVLSFILFYFFFLFIFYL